MRALVTFFDKSPARFFSMSILCACLLTAAVAAVCGELQFGSFGTNDFIEFWSAFQLFAHNNNAYDPEQLNRVQISLGRIQDFPLLLWNPPWILVLLSPVLLFPFSTAAILFVGVSFALLLIGAGLHWKQYREQGIVFAFAGLLFVPALHNIHIGQIGIILFAALTASMWALEKRKDFLAGILLFPLSVKLHLTFLFLIALLWWITRTRRYGVVLGGLATTGVFLGLQFAISPDALTFWLGGFSSPPLYWYTSSLSGTARWALEMCCGILIDWPVVVFPLVGIWVLGFWLLLKRPELSWQFHMPILVACSLMLSPYGWLFDQTLLLCIPLGLLARMSQPGMTSGARYKIVALLILSQSLIVTMLTAGLDQHHYFFWHPLMLLAIWLYGWRITGRL